MGVAKQHNPDPRITDINDPRFTALSNHPDRWLMNTLVGNDDFIYGRGFNQLRAIRYVDGNISPGDYVTLGNRSGVVVTVHKDTNSKSDATIIGLTVNEDLRYLPADYKNNPQAFGYDADGRSKTTTYVFGKDTNLEGIPNGSALMLFQGTIQVMNQYTSDKNTWNTIAQAVDKRNNP